MAKLATRSVELEPIDRLEEKLKLLVAMVDRMKAEQARAAEENLRLSRELEAMRSSAFLLNVGRGEHIDDTALIRALRSGALAGAALDAFDQEPLPANHPFWSLPNLVLTPHISGYTPNYFQKMLALFEDNLDRFVHGRPLRNVVDKQLGYARPAA